MADQITPETVSVNARAEFEHADDVEERLRQLRKLDVGDEFDNQLFDVSDDSAFLAFNNEADEDGTQDSLIITSASQAPPEGEGDDSALAVSANFSYDSINVLRRSFDEILEEIESVTVDSLLFSFTVEREFNSLEPLQPIFEATDHDITGIQFQNNGFAYIFQQSEGNISILVRSLEEFPATSGEFIHVQMEKASPFVKEVAHGSESN